jgi:peptidyl-prolyl cis-trans isomerase D
MLQTLREKTTGWVAVLIVGALAIPFAFVGIENYRNPAIADYVAKVGEIEISRDDFTRRMESQLRQREAELGESYERRREDTPEARRALLDRMIDEALFRQTASNLGLVVPASRIRDEILAVPVFQLDGQFNPIQYRDWLAQQQLTVAGFEQLLTRDIESRDLPLGVATSAIASTQYLDDFLKLRDQKRSFRFVELPAPELAEPPTDADAQARYDENAELYRAEEQVSIEYVEIDPSTIVVSADVEDSVLEERYAQAGRRFVEPEQRLASHILIQLPANSDADAEREALEQAESAAASAQAEGADFSALAAELSQDPGSRNSGGDLGWLERGFTDPAFEEALFSMSSGTVSDPVRSAEGWHVIQLREVRAEVAKPFAEVRDEILREYLVSERDRVATESAGQLVDLLLKDPTALEQTAQTLGIEIKRTGLFTRGGGVDPIVADERVREAAFSPVVLENGLVSDMLDLGGGRRIALRLGERKPSEIQAFEIVKPTVLARLSEERLEAQAKAEAEAVLASVRSGDTTLDAVAEGRTLEVQDAKDTGRSAFTFNPLVVREAFKLAAPASPETPSLAQLSLGGGRFAIVELTSVVAGDPAQVPQEERESLRKLLVDATGTAEIQALAAALRQRAEITLAEEDL